MLGKTYCKGRAASAAPVSTEAAHQRRSRAAVMAQTGVGGWPPRRSDPAVGTTRCLARAEPRRLGSPTSTHGRLRRSPRSRAAATIPWPLLEAGAGQPGPCGRRQRPGSQPPHLLRGHWACGGEGTATRKLQKETGGGAGRQFQPAACSCTTLGRWPVFKQRPQQSAKRANCDAPCPHRRRACPVGPAAALLPRRPPV